MIQNQRMDKPARPAHKTTHVHVPWSNPGLGLPEIEQAGYGPC